MPVRNLAIQTAPVFEPLLRPSRYKGIHGGRGSGKSHFYAEELIERCLRIKRTRWACIREVQLTLDQSVKLLLEDKIRKFGVESRFQCLKNEIVTPGNGLIIFRGMQHYNAGNIKSLEDYDGAWVEEAQDFSQNSLDLLRPTFRREDSEIWFSWNPKDPKDAVDAFFRKGVPPPDSILVQANWYDNPWFPEVLKKDKDYDLNRDPDRYAHIWLGQYRKHSEARVFKNWVVEPFDEPPPGTTFLYGGDWGFSIDPTVLVRCFIVGKTLFVTHEAYMLHCPIDKTPALFGSVPGATQAKIVADSARPETIDYMNGRGFYIVPAVKGKGSVYEGVEFLKSYDIVVHPRCVHTIDELSMYSYKVDKKTTLVTAELEDDNNNVIDSLRYALEGTRRGVSMVDFL